LLPGIEQVDIDRVQSTLGSGTARLEESIYVVEITARVEADGADNNDPDDPEVYVAG